MSNKNDACMHLKIYVFCCFFSNSIGIGAATVCKQISLKINSLVLNYLSNRLKGDVYEWVN